MSQSSFDNFKNGNGVPVFQSNEKNYIGGNSSKYSTYLNVRTSNFSNIVDLTSNSYLFQDVTIVPDSIKV